MAKQNLRDKLIRSGLEALGHEGVATDEPSPALIAPLEERFGREGATDLAIVYLLGRIADPAAAATLRGLAGRAGSKDVKREIRRSLFNLAQKGVVSEQETEAGEAAKPKFSLAPDIEAYLSAMDGRGDYLLVLARPQVGSGLFVLQAAINDRQGLQRIGGAVIRRREFREMIHDMKATGEISMVPLPWRYADWRLHEAYEQGRARGVTGIEEYGQLRTHVTTAPVREEPHPVFNRFDSQEIVESVSLDTTRRLLEENEFRRWVLDEDLIMPYVKRATDLKESRIVLSSVQQGQRLETLVKEAVDGILLDDTLRAVFARRLEDVALHMVESVREEKARSVLRVALALERKETGGLLGIPLLEDFVRRSLALYLRQDEKEQTREPSLIIKP